VGDRRGHRGRQLGPGARRGRGAVRAPPETAGRDGATAWSGQCSAGRAWRRRILRVEVQVHFSIIWHISINIVSNIYSCIWFYVFFVDRYQCRVGIDYNVYFFVNTDG
jgi:hypothetical protein